MKKILALALTLALALPLAACGSSDSGSSAPAPSENEIIEVTVGVVGSTNEQWDTVNELLADEGMLKKLGIVL